MNLSPFPELASKVILSLETVNHNGRFVILSERKTPILFSLHSVNHIDPPSSMVNFSGLDVFPHDIPFVGI